MKTKLLFLLIMVVTIGGLTQCCPGEEAGFDDPEDNIGKTVMIHGVAYTIVNHNSFREEYTLHDGQVISDKYPVFN